MSVMNFLALHLYNKQINVPKVQILLTATGLKIWKVWERFWITTRTNNVFLAKDKINFGTLLLLPT